MTAGRERHSRGVSITMIENRVDSVLAEMVASCPCSNIYILLNEKIILQMHVFNENVREFLRMCF